MKRRLFHGTRAAQEIQRHGFVESTGGEFGPGIYFADNPDTAAFYALRVARGCGDPIVLSACVLLDSPFTIEKLEWIRRTASRSPRTIRRALERRGFDSIIGIGLTGQKQFVVFSPAAISDVRVVERL